MRYFEPEIDFPAELHALSWNDLRQLARFHARMAETCQKRAQRLREIDLMQEQANARADALEDSYKVVLAYLDKGYNSVESAISAAARELSLPEMTVLGWWKIFIRTRDKAARAERNEFILRLVRAGYRNYEIAPRLGVSLNTISRAIGEHLHGSLRPVDRARLRKRRKLSSPAPRNGKTPAGD